MDYLSRLAGIQIGSKNLTELYIDETDILKKENTQ